MPRIRTIKPEFWDSPSTARASAVARLAYIGMWNWADDYGRGTANMKELEGFIFPNDDLPTLSGGTSENFRRVAEEVSDCFGVVFYEVAGRPYYAIPSWDNHQRTERKAKSKFPGPDEADSPLTRDDAANEGKSRNFRRSATEDRGSSGTGTGEQGNRGTGEQGNGDEADASSLSAVASDADAAEPDAWTTGTAELCEHLAERIRGNGNKVGTIGKRWHESMDKLLRLDGYTADQVHMVIDWCQADEFWCSNILSPTKLRQKFPTLVAQMHRSRNRGMSPADHRVARLYAIAQNSVGQEHAPETNPFDLTMKEVTA